MKAFGASVWCGSCLTVGLGLAGATLAADASPQADPSPQEMLQELKALRAEVKDLRTKLDTRSATTQPATAASAPSATNAGPDLGGLQSAKSDIFTDLGHHRSVFADVEG